jgi:threonine/homoserine/homoserine lactone efflux protein
MGAVIGDVLGEAVGVAISPIPIIAMVLILTSAKARSNGFAFLVGWLIGLAVVGSIVLLIADPAGASSGSEPAVWVGWLLLVLGLLLIFLGFRQWGARPAAGQTAAMPKWMEAIDQFNAVRSFGIGFLLAGVNPKNLMLTVAAAATIAGAGLSTGASFGALAVFAVIGTLGLLIPLIIYLAAGERAARLLADLQQWMADNNSAVMAVLFWVIGAKLLGSGVGIVVG